MAPTDAPIAIVGGPGLVSKALSYMLSDSGAKLVIVNRDSTDQDDSADMVIHGEIGATMSRAIGVN